MPLNPSSLSIAAESISAMLEAAIADVHVVVNTPAATQKLAETTPAKHFLNVFFYRVAPSGVHAAQTTDDPLFLRVSALITPFARKEVTNGQEHPALRILGEVLRYFHQNPIGPALQTPLTPGGTEYRIQATMQAPTMEELNHIWTTQGSDISYQLSAAFEFSLIAIDPLELPQPATLVHSTEVEVAPNMALASGGPQDYGDEFFSAPAENADNSWAGPPHLPQVLALGPVGPVGRLDIVSAAGTIPLALAGAVGSRAEITVSVRQGDGAELRRLTAVHEVKTINLSAPEARLDFAANLAGGKVAIVEVRQTDDAGASLNPSRVGNTLTLTIDGGP